MKRFEKYLLTSVLVLALAMTMSACSKSSSDSGPVASSTTTTQAAATTSTTMGAMSTVSSQIGAGLALGLSSIPSNGGYAARFVKKYSGGNIGSIDPTLKMMVDSMTKHSQLPVIQTAVKKAAMLKTARTQQINAIVSCDTGTFTITGSDNRDDVNRTAEIYSYDIVFTSCTNTSDFTEISGSLHVEVNSSLSTTPSQQTSSSSVTATNLTSKNYNSPSFSTSALTYQTVLNGTFSDSDQITSGSMGANGSYVTTYPQHGSVQERVVSFAFTNVADSWTSTRNLDLSDTDVDVANGSFSIATSSGGTENFRFTLALSNLTDKIQYMNDTAGTEKNWIDGSITLGWAPDLSTSGCQPGSIAITTTATDPLIYNDLNRNCPISGTTTINNNAKVEFGTSSGTASDIIVTVNGSSQTYPSCAAFEAAGGACSYQ